MDCLKFGDGSGFSGQVGLRRKAAACLDSPCCLQCVHERRLQSDSHFTLPFFKFYFTLCFVHVLFVSCFWAGKSVVVMFLLKATMVESLPVDSCWCQVGEVRALNYYCSEECKLKDQIKIHLHYFEWSKSWTWSI